MNFLIKSQSELKSAFFALNCLPRALVEMAELSDCVSVALFEHASDVALFSVDFLYALGHEHVERLVLRLDCVGCAAVSSLPISFFVLQTPLFFGCLPLRDLVGIFFFFRLLVSVEVV